MPREVNPEMLVLARECLGLGQKELSEKIGISQSKLSKYENGLLQVSREDLVALSNVLGFPISFFAQTDRVFGFGSACFYHRKRQAMPANELRAIHAKLNLVRMHVTRLARSVEIETDNRFCRLDVDEYGGPEEVARKARDVWSLPMGPVQDVVGTIENAGGIVWALPFGTQRLDAVSQLVPGLPPIFLVNADVPGDRLRFTLAHELGHVLMHYLPNPEMEGQADKFAAEFLLPARETATRLRGLSLHRLPDLKHQWKVSMAALIKRAFDVGSITQRQYRSLFTQLSSHGWRMREPIEVDVEQPTVLTDIFKAYFTDLNYSLGDLCQMLSIEERLFKTLYLWRHEDIGLRVVV